MLSLAGSGALRAGGRLSGHLSYTLGTGVDERRTGGRDPVAGVQRVRLSASSRCPTLGAPLVCIDRRHRLSPSTRM